MRKFKYSLIVESDKKEIIQTAFKRARACFVKVTRIKQSDYTSPFSFTIAPDSDKSEKDNLFKVAEQQAFIQWCVAENMRTNNDILSVKPHHFRRSV